MKFRWWMTFSLLVSAVAFFATFVANEDVSEQAINPAIPSVQGRQSKIETLAPALAPSRDFIALRGDGPFAPRTWQALTPPIVSAVEVKPISAPIVAALPPIPFKFEGKMDLDEDTATVYLSKGEETFSLIKGDVFDTNYRFIALENGKVVIEYLPTGGKQYLPMNSD